MSFVLKCDVKTQVFIVAIVVFGIIALIWAQNTTIGFPVEGFAPGSTANLYLKKDFGGESIKAQGGKKYVLFDSKTQNWLIWSSDVSRNWVFKVTAPEGAPKEMLYMRSPGKLQNLPAALGGLPAKDGYAAIFNSHKDVLLELVPLEDAEKQVQKIKNQCVETTGTPGYCEREHTSLI